MFSENREFASALLAFGRTASRGQRLALRPLGHCALIATAPSPTLASDDIRGPALLHAAIAHHHARWDNVSLP